ncbi:MAG: hypothetical protein H5T82_08455, partial [Demequina sp.]|nr:hypothetical protein [Demequina sp.]
LIAAGCIMMRKCHLNTCPVGVAVATRLRDLPDLDGGGDQPPALRPSRGRGRAGGGLHDRVLVDEVRVVLLGRVHEHDQCLGRRVHPLPGRLAPPVVA